MCAYHLLVFLGHVDGQPPWDHFLFHSMMMTSPSDDEVFTFAAAAAGIINDREENVCVASALCQTYSNSREGDSNLI